MKLSIKWLKEFIPTSKTTEEIVNLFTQKGIEVKSRYRIGNILEGYVVCEIKDINKNEVTIFDGLRSYNISTITYHLRINDKIAFKPQKNSWLNPSLIGLSEDTLPYILPNQYETGSNVLNYLDDDIIELEILPNRGDLLSILGIARELSTYEEITESLNIPKEPEINQNIINFLDRKVQLVISDKSACFDYIARLIYNVKIQNSPFPLQWRLIASGLRPINNVVDATNYIMLKYGTPLHAFDFDRIQESTINVRFAKKGEKIIALDGKEYLLNEQVLLISDKLSPIALAGIIGGKDTEITYKTKKVLLECARFNPQTIRISAKSIQLMTDASQRFEMGIDTNILDRASQEATNLIAFLGNGIVIQDKIECRSKQYEKTINFNISKVNRLLKTNLRTKQIKRIIDKLNCESEEKKNYFSIKIPSYRFDLIRDIDLIEEIARLYGYDKIPSEYVLHCRNIGHIDQLNKIVHLIKNFFVGLGFYECYTISFCDPNNAKLFTEQNIIYLPHPLNERYSALRPNLLVTLLETVKFNYFRSNIDIRLFEIGNIFVNDKAKESLNLTALIAGNRAPLFWDNIKTVYYDFFDIKGISDSFFEYLKLNDIEYIKENINFLTGNSLSLKYKGNSIGFLGEIKRTILQKFDLNTNIYVLSYNLNELLKLIPANFYYCELSRFPAITRDFAFLIKEEHSVQELKMNIKHIIGDLLKNIEVFDYFQGPSLPNGTRNLGIRITLQSNEKTLNQMEVDRICEYLIKYLKDKFNIKIRS